MSRRPFDDADLGALAQWAGEVASVVAATGSDAVLVLDAAGLEVLEASPAAGLLGEPPEHPVGSAFAGFFDARSQASPEELLRSVRASGRPAERAERLRGSHEPVSVWAAPPRGAEGMFLLLRARLADTAIAVGEVERPGGRLGYAVVVTDSSGRVISASREFVGLVQAPSEEAVTGRSLAEWVGSPERSVRAILELVRRHGIAREVRTLPSPRVRGRAVTSRSRPPCSPRATRRRVGFTLRPVVAREPDLASGADGLAGAVGELMQRLGRESLPGLMREGIGLRERQCIAAALELAEHDVEEAARVLGADRRNLERRLRRHHFDLGPGDSGAPTPG